MGIGIFIILLLLAVLFYASYRIQAGIYVKAWCAGKTGRKVVALTFDDGPDKEGTSVVLDILKKYQVKGTFFCIGKKMEENREITRRIVMEGHGIGNHSWNHGVYFPCLTRRKMKEDLLRTQYLLEEITGQDNYLFRPPFGVTNPTIAVVAGQLQYMVIGWSIRSLDTCRKNPGKIFRRIKRQLKPGAVILLHDRLEGCGEILEKLLPYLDAQGYEGIRVDEMFDL